MNPGDADGYAVLFVDDEEKALKYFRMAYARDFPVLTAGSVAEALGILQDRSHEIGVLITDQRMPGQQGVDLLKRARVDWPDIVRILTTAYSDLDDAIAAVNRGEILRYVTKPWDIHGLRAELRHAMDFFLLRRERNLLLSEKLSVRRRMLQADRLRGLLGVAAGLEHLRHAPQAAAAWARDIAAVAPAAEPPLAAQELWGLEVQESMALMELHRKLRRLDRVVEAGFPAWFACESLLQSAGIAVSGQAPEVAGQGALLQELFGILKQFAGSPAVAHARSVSSQDCPGAALTITGPGVGRSRVESDGMERLISAYLIAWHHGGTLATAVSDDAVHLDLTLAVNPASVILSQPDPDWLTEQFAMLEEWER